MKSFIYAGGTHDKPEALFNANHIVTARRHGNGCIVDLLGNQQLSLAEVSLDKLIELLKVVE